MKVAEYIVKYLVEQGVTDVFGIPGGVVLEFLYALEGNKKIIPHLSYHEQCAAFEAGGYAQAGGVVGVAYVTRGPGIMNTATSVADAFCDSLPVMIFTAHGSSAAGSRIRVMDNQEIDLRPIFSTITKYIVRVDRVEAVAEAVHEAFYQATAGRKGPVVIDMAAQLWNQEMTEVPDERKNNNPNPTAEYAADIVESILKSKRPVILAGEGIKQSNTVRYLEEFAEKNHIPVLTSRYSEDILAGTDHNYGYIGSHGIRSANFILSKADLIIGLGNRMAFPVDSVSYAPIYQNRKIVRVDIDVSEFERKIPGTHNIVEDLALLMPCLANKTAAYAGWQEWIETCKILRETLQEYDVSEPVEAIANIIRLADSSYLITSDVGNNELWLSRAYVKSGKNNSILYSKTFGALGCSVAKAIGAYYASKKPVLCFVGDQGLQLNLQELQMVAANKLPIAIIVIDNQSSGMIRSAEKNKFKGRFVQTTKSSGYETINLKKLSEVYDMEYLDYSALSEDAVRNAVMEIKKPKIIEVLLEEECDVTPNLKRGDACQRLFPYIDEVLYEKLERL